MSVIKASRLNTYADQDNRKILLTPLLPFNTKAKDKGKAVSWSYLQHDSIQSNSESLQTDQHLFVPSVTRWRTLKSNRVLSIFLGKTIMARSQFWIYFFSIFLTMQATTHPRRPEAMLTAALPPPSYSTIIHPCSQEWHKNKHFIHKYLYTACSEQHSASL